MEKTRFEKELKAGQVIKVNGRNMPMAIYNLIISKRDLKLWQIGLKPHRNWKVNDVKKYFGLKGRDRRDLVIQIEELIIKHS